MPSELKLSLPERKPSGGGSMKLALFVLFCLLLLSAAQLTIALLPEGSVALPEKGNGAAAEMEKALALKLEKQGLNAQAAQTWQSYLEVAVLEESVRASIWYRVGKLYQEAGDEGAALAAYYRAEAVGLSTELAGEVGRRAEQCLEALGKFAALRYELAGRVGVDGGDSAPGGAVLAEIGPEKITQADLDRRIEKEVDRQITQYAAFMPEAQRKQQKQEILKQFSAAEGRMRMLNQIVSEELLYRKAREDRIAERPEVRELLLAAERGLLAQKVIEESLERGVNITESDVATFYEANKQDYAQPERAKISHIQVATEEAARDALARLEAGEDFAEVAKELSQDEATRGKGGEIAGWVVEDGPVPGIGPALELVQAVFAAEPGTLVSEAVQGPEGFHVVFVKTREPARQQSLEEVGQQVYQSLATQKRGEVQTALLEGLRDEYDVVIHFSQFGAAEKEEEKDDAV